MGNDNIRDIESINRSKNHFVDTHSLRQLEPLIRNDGFSPENNVDIEQPVKLPYPKRVFFIIGSQFCERFNYFGLKAILVLYMTTKLNFDEKTATVYFHTFTMIIYFTCLFGAFISDNWLGKFKTILYLSIACCFGNLIMVIGSIPHHKIPSLAFMDVALILIALAVGGMRPCIYAFAGDQFILPAQVKYMTTLFSLLYSTINVGTLTSTTITPMLRAKVYCFGEHDCYPLAFGVPAILMITSIILFSFGKPWYSISNPSENVLAQVTRCIMNAFKTKRHEAKTHPRKHFLDYSVEKFGQQVVGDTKRLLNLMLLFLPTSMYWALSEQQGSSWVLQATKLNANLGFHTILPDQMQALNSILFIVFVPLFDYILYPLLSQIGLRRPLQKIALSGILGAIAILMSAILEWRIQMEPPNSLSILWQIPQIVTMTIGDMMFCVTGIAFAYEQSPKHLKSIVQSFRLLTVAFGNAVIAIITKLNFFESQVHVFLLFFGLMTIDLFIFIALAHKYKCKQNEEPAN